MALAQTIASLLNCWSDLLLGLELCRDFLKKLIGEVDFSTSPLLQCRKNCVEILAFLDTELLSNSKFTHEKPIGRKHLGGLLSAN